jgi:hypothetical protein
MLYASVEPDVTRNPPALYGTLLQNDREIKVDEGFLSGNGTDAAGED